jgi:hypothetical protein
MKLLHWAMHMISHRHTGAMATKMASNIGCPLAAFVIAPAPVCAECEKVGQRQQGGGEVQAQPIISSRRWRRGG